MASAGADKVVRIWEPGSGAQKAALHGMLETVTEARLFWLSYCACNPAPSGSMQ
jgi:hypothetical protein